GRVMGSEFAENMSGGAMRDMGDISGWFNDYWVWQTITLGAKGIRLAWEAEGATSMLVGLVAAIGMPIYQGMMEDAKWSEARAIAATLRSNLEVYAVENNGFGELTGTRLMTEDGE